MNTLSYILLYLDPGTGSMIIQLAIAAVTAAFFFLKSVRQRLSEFFRNLRNKNHAE